MKHVLDINAYDHVLFLIVLTVPYLFNNWKRVLLLVSTFTLGHTLSLVLAAYGVVKVNPQIVEFLIPVTILIVAVFNVFTAGKNSQKEKLQRITEASLMDFDEIADEDDEDDRENRTILSDDGASDASASGTRKGVTFADDKQVSNDELSEVSDVEDDDGD